MYILKIENKYVRDIKFNLTSDIADAVGFTGKTTAERAATEYENQNEIRPEIIQRKSSLES